MRHRYADREVLALDRLTVARGEHHLVCGPSGSGKTTLLHVIAGLLRPDAGEVRVDGERLEHLTPSGRDRLRARRIGIVLQRLHLMSSLTVLENLLLARYLAGLVQDRHGAFALLDRLGLGSVADALPGTLSRGEAQRAALARALVNEPVILLADEPTASLDDGSCAAAIDLLVAEASSRRASLLIATHDARVRERFGPPTVLRRCD